MDFGDDEVVGEGQECLTREAPFFGEAPLCVFSGQASQGATSHSSHSFSYK